MKRFILLAIPLFFAFDLYAQCPILSISGSNVVCVGSTVIYSATSNDIISRANITWKVNGGGVISVGQTFSRIDWHTAGTWQIAISYQACNANPNPLTTFEVTVVDSPANSKPSQVTGNNLVCSGSTSSYTIPPLSGQTVVWNISNFDPLNTILPALVQNGNQVDVAWPNSAGNYYLTAAYSNGSCSGSQAIIQITSSLGNRPVAISSNGTDRFCLSEQFIFNAYGSAQDIFTWTTPFGQITGQQAAVQWNSEGTFTITLSAVNPCNPTPRTASRTVTVGSSMLPAPGNISTSCSVSTPLKMDFSIAPLPGAILYRWYISNSSSTWSDYLQTTSPTLSFIFSTIGKYSIKVTASNGYCEGPYSPPQSFDVGIAPISLNYPTTVCGGDNVIITANSVTDLSGATFSWNVSDGTVIGSSNTNPITVQWNTTGSKFISVGISNSCNNSPVYPIPQSPGSPARGLIVQSSVLQIPVISGVSNACLGRYLYTVPRTESISELTWDLSLQGGGSTNGGTIQSPPSPPFPQAYIPSTYVIWNTAGYYTLTATASNACGMTQSYSYNISVASDLKPTTRIINESTFDIVCQGTFKNYSAPLVNGITYNWELVDIGNNIITSNYNTASIEWNQTGYFNLSVTPSTASCSGEKVNLSTSVYPIPVMNSISSFATCNAKKLNIELTSSEPSSYYWIAIDNPNVTGESLTLQYSGFITNTLINNSPSLQMIEYVVTPKYISSSCTGSPQTITVTVYPEPSITNSLSTTTCSGTTLDYALTSSIPSAFNWIAANNPNVTGESTTIQSSPTINNTLINTSSVVQVVNYTVTPSSITGECLGSSKLLSISVNPVPVVTVSAGGSTTFCQGGSVTLTATAGTSYLWSGGETQQSITVNASGNYSVIVTNSSGCATTSAPVSVVVNPLPVATITANGATTFCQGGTVTLTAPTASSYLWSNGATSQSILVSTAGNYNVTTTNTSGCSATSSPVTATVYSIPVATITASGPTTFCQGGSVTLTASPGSRYLWSTGAISQSITIGASGSYWVTVSNGVCETVSAPISVVVNAIPSPIINGKKILCNEAQTTLTAVSGISESVNYQWSNGSTNPSVTVGLGNYTVTVTNSANSNCSATTTARVTRDNSTGSITSSGNLCQGGQVLLMAGSGSSYIWSNGQTGSAIYVSVPGTYNVDYYNNAGCYVGASFKVMPPKPNCSIARVSSDSAPNLLSSVTASSDTSVPASVNISALDSEAEKSAELFLLFPNPAKQILNIRLSAAANVLSTVEIFDPLGKLMHRSALEAGETDKQINIADFSGGVYVVQLRNHNQLMKKRIIFTGN